jgi:Rod binding domain-containing protein
MTGSIDPTAGREGLDHELRRLDKASKDFEAVMLSTLLKEAKVTMPGGGGPAGAGLLGDFAAEAMSRAIAGEGGFGLAEVLFRVMEPQVRATHADEGQES